jgi:hypothetical protein
MSRRISHLFSREFLSLIRAIGECKAKAEEAKLMEAERVSLKRAISDNSSDPIVSITT